MTLLLTDQDIRKTFQWGDAVDALRDVYSQPSAPGSLPARTMARAAGGWLRTLSGVMPEGGPMGAKLIAASTQNRRASYLISLFDQESTSLRALLDGNAITGYRTAATSALAVDRIAPARPLRVAVIGSGFEAQHHLHALAAVRQISEARVYSPSPASRARFVDAMVNLDCDVTATDMPNVAVHNADVVLCAARSRDESPTLLGDWVEPGMTIVSVGSTLPEQRELDWKVIEKASVIVADMPDEVVDETGDMIAASHAGVDVRGRVIALYQLISSTQNVRSAASDIVIYKSVGSALQDLTIADLCLRRAGDLGIGSLLPASIEPAAK